MSKRMVEGILNNSVLLVFIFHFIDIDIWFFLNMAIVRDFL